MKNLVFSHEKQFGDLWINTEKYGYEDTWTLYNFEGQKIEAYSEGPNASVWFSDVINQDVVLIRSRNKKPSSTHDYQFHYNLDKNDVRNSMHTHAAIHLISEASVKKLNSMIEDKSCEVNAEAFRPNIVIDGINPDEEDDLRELELESTKTNFRHVKHCVRCKTTTYNPKIGKMNPSKEPLKTLAKYKTHPEIGTVFGIFIQADEECTIKGKRTQFSHVLLYSGG